MFGLRHVVLVVASQAGRIESVKDFRLDVSVILS